MTGGGSGRKVALLLRLLTSTQQRVEWLLWEDKCAWRKSNYSNTQNFIGKPPSSLQVDWDMKSGEVQVERWEASLPEGQSTHDNPSTSYLFHSVCSSTRLPAWWSKHIGPLAFWNQFDGGFLCRTLWCCSVIGPWGVLQLSFTKRQAGD